MSGTAIERSNGTHQNLAVELWGRERLEVLKQQIAPQASDADLDLFATVCRRTGLDPFARQIWSIPRRRQVEGRWETYQVIQIGVHGLRLIAARSHEYGGQDGPYFCGLDGRWTDTWLSNDPPAAARVGVKRKGWELPLYSVAVWERAVQRDKDGKPQALWKTRGPEQLALAAERDALRRAFPLETADVEVIVDEEAHAARYAEVYDDEAEQERIDAQTARAHPPMDDAERLRLADMAEFDRQRREEGLK